MAPQPSGHRHPGTTSTEANLACRPHTRRASLRARIAAHTLHAKVDPLVHTEPAAAPSSTDSSVRPTPTASSTPPNVPAAPDT